jgi:cholesterol transport system auxiliary component
MSNAINPTRRLLLLGGAAVTLSACSGLIGPVGDNVVYVLQPVLQKSTGRSVSWGLVVARPDADQTLDTNRISISRTPTTMDYYANAVWSDRLTSVIQDLTVRAFEVSGRIAAVDSDSLGAHADYELDIGVRHFEARYDTADGPPVAVVTLHAKLVTKLKQIILGDFETSHETPASANTIDAAVMAFDTAFSAALVDLVEWTLQKGPPVPA